MRVVVALDSLKGSVTAAEASLAVADGWRAVRPRDVVIELPQADGGEGTIDAIAATGRWRTLSATVTGPDRRPVAARWLRGESCSAVVELAESSGIALMSTLAPMTATSCGLGEVIVRALDSGVRRIQVALGGSASTDGGFGLLCALGLKAYDRRGRRLDGDGVDAVAAVDPSEMRSPPADGAEALVDTTAPLFGTTGAAYVFGPQKGADPDCVRYLDDRLRNWSDVLGAAGLTADPRAPASGAAGGVGYALSCWGAVPTSGADRIAAQSGLAESVPAADLVVTGEGRFDRTSLSGKVVGRVLERCSEYGVASLVVAGQVAEGMPGDTVSLTDLAGSTGAALADPVRWLREAGSRAGHRAYATAAHP